MKPIFRISKFVGASDVFWLYRLDESGTWVGADHRMVRHFAITEDEAWSGELDKRKPVLQ